MTGIRWQRWLAFLTIAAVLLAVAALYRSERVPEFRLIACVPASDALARCDAGLLLAEGYSRLVLRDWQGQAAWFVPLPEPDLTGRPAPASSPLPLQRGWIAAVGKEGDLLAVVTAEGRATGLTVFSSGRRIFSRLFPWRDDYPGLAIFHDRVFLWGRSSAPAPIAVVEKSRLLAQGILPWRGIQFTPGGAIAVAPDKSSRYCQYHGYHCVLRAHYGLMSVADGRVAITGARLLSGVFSVHQEPQSLSGVSDPGYPRILDEQLLFTGGIILSLDGKRFGPQGAMDPWPTLGGSWQQSRSWISYTPGQDAYPHEVIAAATGERWPLPVPGCYPRYVADDGHFLLIDSMPHRDGLADLWWECGHSELTSPTGRGQERRYLGVLERPGTWRAVLPIATDIEDYWPQGSSRYGVCWPVLSPDGQFLTLIGLDRRRGGAACALFFSAARH